MDIYTKLEKLIHRKLTSVERERLKENYSVEFKNHSVYLVNVFNNKVVMIDNRMVKDKSDYERNAKHLMYNIYTCKFTPNYEEYDSEKIIRKISHKIKTYIANNINTVFVRNVSIHENVIILEMPNKIKVSIELKRVQGIENISLIINYNKGLSKFNFKDYIHVQVINNEIEYIDENKLYKIVDMLYDNHWFINVLINKYMGLANIENVRKLRENGYKLIMEIGNNFTGNRFTDFIHFPNDSFFKEERITLKYMNGLDRNNDISLYIYKKENKVFVYSYTVYTDFIKSPILLDDLDIEQLINLIKITEKERKRKLNIINEFNRKSIE